MLFKDIIIKTDPSLQGGTCTLPRDIFLFLGSDKNHTVTLSAGNRQTIAVVKHLTAAEAKTLRIAPDIGGNLCLPPHLEWRLNLDTGPQRIRLGPFIGIYGFKRLTGGRIFSEQTSYFRKLCQVARHHGGVAYIIAPDDLDFEAGCASGHILIPGENGPRWARATLPIPEVFYDRGLFPRGPGKTKSMQVRRYLRATWGDKFFNPKFFDKWRTHRWVCKSQYLKNYLPATVPLKNFELAEKLINSCPSLYLKPSGGSSGRGIIRVQHRSEKLVAEFFRKRQFHQMEYSNAAELWTDLLQKEFVNNTYLVQEDLNLAHYNSKPFDVRGLVQKDLSGTWCLTGMAARISGANAITTNLHAGGTAEKIEIVLASIFGPAKAAEIEAEIKKLSLLTCAWVEEISGLKFGEIAVDIGISRDGKPRLIELNAVPGRMIFAKINDQGLRRAAVARPIEYACYLAGFSSRVKKRQELI